MIYIFDIDGTIADCSHRLHFIEGKPQDWKAFYAASGEDKPIKKVIEIAKCLESGGHKLVMITGRSSECRAQTIEWMLNQVILFDSLYMRKEGDHRQDNIVKSELLDQCISEFDLVEIGGIFEDRQQCVDMYRARGLRVFQVAEGKF